MENKKGNYSQELKGYQEPVLPKISPFYVEVKTCESIPIEAQDYRNVIPTGNHKVLISKQAMKNNGLDTDVDKETLEINCQQFLRNLTHKAREYRVKN